MINGVTAAVDSGNASAVMKQTIGMNKDDFLKLFITQLQNQDPLKPMDGTEFLAQLAQLTQVEQAYNVNSKLASIIDSLNSSSALSAVSFIGKEITAYGSDVLLTSGKEARITFNAPRAAEQLTVTIRDANGNTVRILTRGETAAGQGSMLWDGNDGSGNALPPGTYTFSVRGRDAEGITFACENLFTGKVDGVEYSGAAVMLTVGGKQIPFNSIVGVKEAA